MEGEEEEIYNTGNTEYTKEKFQSYLTEDKTWEDIKLNDLKTQKIIYIRLYGLYLPSLRTVMKRECNTHTINFCPWDMLRNLSFTLHLYFATGYHYMFSVLQR